LKQNDAEKHRLLAALREQKKQRQRLVEKLLDSERVQESLQMNVEELRVIAK
jgi:K+-sensing histidine kinase KdpD